LLYAHVKIIVNICIISSPQLVDLRDKNSCIQGRPAWIGAVPRVGGTGPDKNGILIEIGKTTRLTVQAKSTNGKKIVVSNAVLPQGATLSQCAEGMLNGYMSKSTTCTRTLTFKPTQPRSFGLQFFTMDESGCQSESFQDLLVFKLQRPKIKVFIGKDYIKNGENCKTAAHCDWGTMHVNDSAKKQLFIQNIGNSALKILAPVKLAFTQGFVITSQPPMAPIKVGGTAMFDVTFSPAVEGLNIADIVIKSDAENVVGGVYGFRIRGTGTQQRCGPVGKVVTDMKDKSLFQCSTGTSPKPGMQAIVCKGKKCLNAECCLINEACGFKTCPKGQDYKDNLSQVICALKTCTAQECCADNPKCPSHTCPAGTMHKKAGSATIVCTKKKCTNADCCDPNPRCTGTVCKATFHLNPNHAALTCSTKVCSDKDCCLQNPQCAKGLTGGPFDCGTGATKPPAVGVVYCKLGTCGYSECCVDKVKEVSVEGKGNPIANTKGSKATTCGATVADGTDFASLQLNKDGPVTHTFTIRNKGNAPVQLTGPILIDGHKENGVWKVVAEPPPATSLCPCVKTGDPCAGPCTADFKIMFTPHTAESGRTGSFLGTVFVPNSAKTYTFGICGLANAPKVELRGNDKKIVPANIPKTKSDPDYDNTDCGTMFVIKGEPIVRTFTIHNTGDAPLNLQNAAPAASEYKILKQPEAVLAPGGSTSFDVQFTASDKGDFPTSITIKNDARNIKFNMMCHGKYIMCEQGGEKFNCPEKMHHKDGMDTIDCVGDKQCDATECCNPNPTCAVGFKGPCMPTNQFHLTYGGESIVCVAKTCAPTDCCGLNDKCGEYPCDVSTHHEKDAMRDIRCPAEKCRVSDCCVANPYCAGNKDGHGQVGCKQELAFLSFITFLCATKHSLTLSFFPALTR
jgi:hypothetical protein